MSNSLIGGYTTNNENRTDLQLFPFVDILAPDGTTYTSFGSEPFTPNNELLYQTYQLQDNFTKFSNRHSLTFGFTTPALRGSEFVLQLLQAGRLRLQLAGRLLRGRQRLSGEPEPDDVAHHAAAIPGAMDEHPRAGQAASRI